MNILLVYQNFSTFVEKDYELLSKHFKVRTIHWNNINKLYLLIQLLIGILRSDVTVSWFADVHALWAVRFSKTLRKKSIVVIGGYEVAKILEINYGALLNPKLVPNVRYILKNANIIITVDEVLKIDAIKNSGVNGDNILTIPTGYNYEQFRPNGEKENLIITVASGNYWERARLKGLDIFVESAKFLSNFKFIVIGIEGDALKKLKKISPPNVDFIMQLTQEMVIPYYQKAKVYCQLSMREGLPNALCEAMLCECIPVGSDVQGVRTAIGDAGFLVPYGDAEATAKAIIQALKSDKGKDARERIKRLFPIERRETELIQTIKEVLQGD